MIQAGRYTADMLKCQELEKKVRVLKSGDCITNITRAESPKPIAFRCAVNKFARSPVTAPEAPMSPGQRCKEVSYLGADMRYQCSR